MCRLKRAPRGGILRGVLLTCLATVAPVAAADVDNAAWTQARNRPRRIIMNNDGNDNPPRPATTASLLTQRFVGLENSHVDTIFYCTGVFNLYRHRSGESEQVGFNGKGTEAEQYTHDLNALDTDCLEIAVRWAHEHDKEIFWSMRMNDTHDHSDKHSHRMSEWKKEHPEYLLGKRGDVFAYGGKRWSALDYGLGPVREKAYRIVRDVCTRYDIDGIELDFIRFLSYFPEATRGEPVPPEKMDRLTDLLRRVRKLTTELAGRRGRPLLTAIRVPVSLKYCRGVGLDVRQWLEERLVDIVTGGGDFRTEPWEDLVAIGRKYDLPVYAGFDRRRIGYEHKVWRGEALSAWDAGVDGIYLFNRFNPHFPIFDELGDPALLRSLSRVDQSLGVGPPGRAPYKWCRVGERYRYLEPRVELQRVKGSRSPTRVTVQFDAPLPEKFTSLRLEWLTEGTAWQVSPTGATLKRPREGRASAVFNVQIDFELPLPWVRVDYLGPAGRISCRAQPFFSGETE